MKKIFFILFSIVFLNAISQEAYNPLKKPNTYRQVDNPNYWKNKAPIGYWQQDVHYIIKANIDETKDIIDANQKLIYWNNSPDTLQYVYFHLYQNAFIPGSYCSELYLQNNSKPKYGKYEKKGLGTIIEDLTVSGKQVKTELDNTILKVYLNQPLISGDSITFEMNFKTYFDIGNMRRRMKKFNSFGNTHYDGVLWYPRISVYDKKFGWTTDQHLGKEFYGDFGTWDVELTFSSNYIVEATGALQNKKEVMPDNLREKLDIKNFANKVWNSKPSIIIPYDSLSRKTWIYHAENVHDFAFTADPSYRIGEVEWNGIKAISMVQEPHASKWQNAAQFAADVIKVFSEDIGMYTYHKVIVADARDGMEYPMITLDGGKDPSYRGLLAHEIGHQWFYAQVGSNETYRAALDEGFTQFLTSWALNKIDGEYLASEKTGNIYKDKYKKDVKAIDSRVYYSYLRDATKFNDPRLNTHSHDFESALGHGGGYRHVYYKTAAMLYNLEYVLGKELFLKSLQHYFQKWKIAHPYFSDFREAIIEYTKVDLNWFFDQWLETEKSIDYSIKNVKNLGQDKFEIEFERKRGMQMPIDFSIYSNDGKEYKFHIPNQWFIKKTDATILEKWHAWGKIFPNYKTQVKIPSGIKNIIIDPSYRLADSYMLNNSKKIPVEIEFDSKIWNLPNWRKYNLRYRPDIWWNSYDGIKAGLHFNGDYLRYHHKIKANLWINTGLIRDSLFSNDKNYNSFSFRLSYKTGLDKIMKNGNFILKTKFLDGLHSHQLGLEKYDYKKKNKLYSYFKSMYRPNKSDLNYLLYPGWDFQKFNNTATFGWEHSYKHNTGKGKINFEITSSSFGSDYNYSKISTTSINKFSISKFKFNTRIFAQIGSGDNWADESKLYLSGANPEELSNNKFTRSQGLISSNWTEYGNTTNIFHMGGGLNLRGYNSYLAPEIINGEYSEIYSGYSGASINLEIEFQEILPIIKNQNKLITYLFSDAGVINNSMITYNNFTSNFSKFRMDAGLGLALTIDYWLGMETIKPFTIRLDFPIFLNKHPFIDDSNINTNRFIIGIGRAF